MQNDKPAQAPLSKAERRRQAAELHNANYAYKAYVSAQETGLARIKAQARLERELDEAENTVAPSN